MTRVQEFTATKVVRVQDEGDHVTIVFQSEQRELILILTRTAYAALTRHVMFSGPKMDG